MVLPTAGEVRSTAAVIALGITAFFTLLLRHSQPREKGGREHLHFHPQLWQAAFWGFGMRVFGEGESRLLVLSSLLAGK